MTATLADTTSDASICPVTGLRVVSPSQWTTNDLGRHFRLTSRLIGDRILFIRPTGHVKQGEITKAIRRNEAIVHQHIGHATEFVVVIDFSGLLSITRDARRSCSRYLAKQPFLKQLVFFGDGPLSRVLTALTKRLQGAKIGLTVAGDYREAMSAAVRSLPAVSTGKTRPETLSQQTVVDQLLQFIETIDWSRPGVPQRVPVDPQHPFRPVFDAIASLKAELDGQPDRRQEAESALSASQQRFTALLDSMDAYIHVVDFHSGEVLFMNKALRDASSEKGADTPCAELLNSTGSTRPEGIKDQLADERGRSTGPFRWEWFNPNNHHWYLKQERSIRWVDGRLAQLQIATDITRLKTFESERQQITERMEQSRKLDAVRTMAGGVAHHFNNLLMVILGNLELMRLEVAKNSRLGQKIDTLEKSARRAADLSTLLLTYVGQTRISPQVIDLNTVLSEMMDVLKTSVTDQTRITFAPSADSAWIYADTAKTYEVITNLVNNALEAADDCLLHVQIQVGCRFFTTLEIEQVAPGQHLSQGYYAWLRVSDNGRGMDAETLEKVFDPFFTTKFTGRGLGMASVLGIMRAHRGGVQIESQPDAGTTVTVYFPESKRTAPTMDAQNPSPPASPDADKRGTMLLVDDEPLVLELGRELLSHMGFDVLTAEDGLEALTLFDTHRKSIRMAVVDINMPRMGGRETIQRLRGRGASFPILVASGYTDAQSKEKMGDVKVEGYLQKPFRVEEFKEKINAQFGAPDSRSSV